MNEKKLEQYPIPDKRKTPKISQQFVNKRQLRTKSILIDDYISSQVKLINEINIQSHINELITFHNRHSKSHFIHQVAEWIRNKLIDFGYSENDLFYHEYIEQGYQLKNLICIKKGVSDKIILLCAHYDTILISNTEDIVSRAPGANDNASGVSALLEIARIMLSIKTDYTIQFVFFSGEEQGLWGSKHYAKKMKDNNEDLLLVINMDMCGETGFLSNNNTTFIDIDDGSTGIIDENNEMSQHFGQKMEQYAKDYTQLAIEFDPIYASDYMPFEARGYVCIGAYDGSAIDENPHYHTQLDIPENLNIPFLTSVTKMVLAFVLLESHYIING
jgi:aminopeptidase-like protein